MSAVADPKNFWRCWICGEGRTPESGDVIADFYRHYDEKHRTPARPDSPDRHQQAAAEVMRGQVDYYEIRDAIAAALAAAEVAGYRAGVADAERGIYVPGSEALAAAEQRGRDDTARKVPGVTPAQIAEQRSLGWPDFHPEDFCHTCGRPNPNWFADTKEWREATHSTDDGGGILCPSCFCALWEQETGKTAIIWRLSIGGGRDAVPPSPDADEVERVARHLADRLVTLVGYEAKTPMTATGLLSLESARTLARAALAVVRPARATGGEA